MQSYREVQGEIEIFTSSSLPKLLQLLGLDQAKARSPELYPGLLCW